MNSPSLLQTLNKYLDPSTPVGRFLRVMMWTILALMGVGLLVVLLQPVADRTTSLLLALSCLLLGAFVGFLFGIPRVLQADGGPGMSASPLTEPQTAPGVATTQNAYQQQVNTNLEQISDWLTKIIVGLGLVNLYAIPDLLRDTSTLIADGIASSENTGSVIIFANALLLYFPVLGFLVGYLITRIFLSGVFHLADTNRLMNVGGQEVDMTQVVQGLVKVITDPAPPLPGGMAPASTRQSVSTSPARKRILWVDDTPANNVIERATLNKAGIEVVAVESTQDALIQLTNSSFDVLITDTGRSEPTGFNPKAGIGLIRKIKERNLTIPQIIVYTNRKGFDQYDEEARQAGADDVVYSPRILLKSIGLTETI